MAKPVDVKLARGWGAPILNGEAMARAINTQIQRVAQIARSTAPRDTGDYAASITTGTTRRDRIVGLVISDDPGALAIEAKYGTLARALRAARRG